jgi:phosphosulfolactate phosphohydrolase-like enzyme
MKGELLLLLVLLASSALAEMPIVYMSESSLPYEFSSANYDNSPVNYDNSLANYENSAANYTNSSANYDNSPANYENGLNGNHRLYYLPDKIHMTWAGYFVVRDKNYVNFFSPFGRRVFYSPAGHAGVFSAEDGSFCGVVAKIQEKISLVLISHGTEVFHQLNDR